MNITTELPVKDYCRYGKSFINGQAIRHWTIVEGISNRGYGPRCAECNIEVAIALSEFREPE